MRASYARRMANVSTVSVIPGRVFEIRLQSVSNSHLQLIAAHIDRSFSGPRLTNVMHSIQRTVDTMLPHHSFVGGGWNFVEQAEGQVHTMEGNRHSMSAANPIFHIVLSDLVANDQPLHTFRRTTATATDVTYSHIDRWP